MIQIALFLENTIDDFVEISSVCSYDVGWYAEYVSEESGRTFARWLAPIPAAYVHIFYTFEHKIQIADILKCMRQISNQIWGWYL